MSTTTARDPHNDPWHSNPQTKAAAIGARAAVAKLQAGHAAAIAAAQRAVSGAKLTAVDVQEATDFLAALAEVIAGTPDIAYKVHNAIDGIRMRRRAEAPAAAA